MEKDFSLDQENLVRAQYAMDLELYGKDTADALRQDCLSNSSNDDRLNNLFSTVGIGRKIGSVSLRYFEQI